ncbi:MAG: hypothetical protein QM778_00505 [Myxococcales bacterium]
MRFTIRDLLWLTVTVAMGSCWWRCWNSIPRLGGTKLQGFFLVAGKPVSDGRAFLHFADGEFRGTNVVNGMFLLEHIPMGKYRVTFDGEDVPANRFGVEVGAKDELVNITFDVRTPFSAPTSTVAGSANPIVR